MNDEKKILFLHGFFASGQCVPAVALREAFETAAGSDDGSIESGNKYEGRVQVLLPDLPLRPKEVLALVRDICEREKPDVLVGNSCGSFYAQLVASDTGIPALLGNPHFQMTEFLKQRIGEHQYKSPRRNGNQTFVIDEALIEEFAEWEKIQFDRCNEATKEQVWGLFGEKDTLAHFEPLFLQHYAHSFHFPGGHTPTADEVKLWYVPLIEKLLRREQAKE